MRRFLLALLFVIVGLGPVSHAAHAGDGELTAHLQHLLGEFQEAYSFPGATAAVVWPDGSVDMAAVGWADREREIPMTSRHRMLAASIGKTVWGVLVLDLEADGLLSRSDHVSKYLGRHQWFADLPNAETMTIGHLLTHSAGLPDHVHLEGAGDLLISLGEGGSFDPASAVALILDEPPLFAAGEGWAYSDTGYLLLGMVIEAATGLDVFDVAKTRLEETGFVPSTKPDIAALAIGYTAEANPFGLPARTADETGVLLWNPAIEWTGGGYAATSADLALWGQRLFSGAAAKAPYLDRLLDGVAIHPDAPGVYYGAGVAIYADTPAGPVYGHGGWIPGYVSSLRHYADHRITVAFQINSDVGILDDSTDLVPALERAIAELVLTSRGR